MPRSSLYREGINSKELDEKWIEVYEKDMDEAESFCSIQKIKYILVGIVIGLSINMIETMKKPKKGRELDARNLEENQAAD